jgi:hypothetical protein
MLFSVCPLADAGKAQLVKSIPAKSAELVRALKSANTVSIYASAEIPELSQKNLI